MGCPPTVSTMTSSWLMPTEKRSTGRLATKRSWLLRRGEESDSWRYQHWPRSTGRVVQMHCGDGWDSPITRRKVWVASTPACVKPSDLSRTNVVQAPEISRLWRIASFEWKNGPCATCACLFASVGAMKLHSWSTFCRHSVSSDTPNSKQSRL